MKRFLLPALVFIAFAAQARASVMMSVTFDASSVTGLTGPFSLAFMLGGGSEGGNNTAVLSNFQLLNGTFDGAPILDGGATGDVFSGFTLPDSFGTVIQTFTSFGGGSILTFNVLLTTNVDSGGLPDEFIWSILDGTFTPVSTTSTSPLDPLLAIMIDSEDPAIATFSGDSLPFLFTPSYELLEAEVPEPSTWLLMLGGLAATVGLRRRLR